MPRYFYIHFNGEVPEETEKIYNKMRRSEQYLEERDKKNGLIYFSDESELLNFEFKGYSIESENEKLQERIKKDHLLYSLEKALKAFQKYNPEGYDIILKYYFLKPSRTLDEIGVEYLISKQAVSIRIHKYLKELKKMIEADNPD